MYSCEGKFEGKFIANLALFLGDEGKFAQKLHADARCHALLGARRIVSTGTQVLKYQSILEVRIRKGDRSTGNDFFVTRAASGQKSRGGGGREFSISYLYSGLLYSWISQMACI